MSTKKIKGENNCGMKLLFFLCRCHQSMQGTDFYFCFYSLEALFYNTPPTHTHAPTPYPVLQLPLLSFLSLFPVQLRRGNALWVCGFPVTPVTAEIHGACTDANGAGSRQEELSVCVCVCVYCEAVYV